MKKKFLVASLIVLLIVSVFFNIKSDDTWYVSFQNANTRPESISKLLKRL